MLLSIAFNESSLNQAATNGTTKDYGLMQINQKTILRYGLDESRLMKDMVYSLRAACRILRDNHDKYGDRYVYWIGIYRSGTALWREEIRRNAESYDRIIRRTAKRIGFDREIALR